jgi:hypothetical protein
MLTMRDHDIADYTDLRDMDATDVGVLGDDDRACLKELGQYLVAADAWQRFAIWLLHKHFEPTDGQIFVESAIEEPRKIETALIDRSALGGDALHTTAVRFDETVNSGVGVIGMEFSRPAHFGPTAPLSPDDEDVLAGIAQRLKAHDKTDRFGVKLIRDPLGLAPHEVLLETCDTTHHLLTSDVTERSAIRPETFTETVWNYRPVQGEVDMIVMQDCNIGCFTAGEGHELQHGQGQGDDQDD